jgi:hypothetical protein
MGGAGSQVSFWIWPVLLVATCVCFVVTPYDCFDAQFTTRTARERQEHGPDIKSSEAA